ncbi:MAG: hypothetical protein AAGC55_21655 [Myxococcota bacterium]
MTGDLHTADHQYWVDRMIADESIAGTFVDLYLDERQQDESQKDKSQKSVDELLTAVASHPALTWALLSRQRDRGAAIYLFEHRVHHFLCGELWGAISHEFESPEFVRDAAGHGELEGLALRVASAQVWFEPRGAARMYDDFRSDSRAELAPLYRLCDKVMVLALDWHALSRKIDLPAPLTRFVAMQWAASAPVLDLLIADLRRDMTGQVERYLEVFDAMAVEHLPLLSHVVGLSERFLPDLPHSLGDLGEEEQRLLSAALEEIDAPAADWGGPSLWRTGMTALTAAAGLSLVGYDIAGVAAATSIGAAALAYRAWSERGLYGRLIRPRLAAHLAAVGTPTKCVVSWLLDHGGRLKKVRAFDVIIDADTALDAIARLGRMNGPRDAHLAGG